MQAASGSERTGSTAGVVPTSAITRNCRVCSEPDPPVSTGGFLARRVMQAASGSERTGSASDAASTVTRSPGFNRGFSGSGGGLRAEQPGPECLADGRWGIADVELFVDSCHMAIDSRIAEVQMVRDFLLRHPLSE